MIDLHALGKAAGWPIEGNEWEQWRARIFNQMIHQFGNPGLAPLEQFMLRSRKEKRCIECGEPGEVSYKSVIIASVGIYWMCLPCAASWETKYD